MKRIYKRRKGPAKKRSESSFGMAEGEGVLEKYLKNIRHEILLATSRTWGVA